MLVFYLTVFFLNSFGHSKLINKKVRHKYYNIVIFYKLRNGQLSPMDCFEVDIVVDCFVMVSAISVVKKK